MSRPSAVVISPEAPYPMHGGGAIRTASLLEYLSQRYAVDLILFRQEGNSDPALSLPSGLARQVSTITLPFHSRRPLAWLLRNGRRWVLGAPPLLHRFSGQAEQMGSFLRGRKYDVGLVEHFWCAPYVEQLSGCCARTVLDLHNVESELHASCARTHSWPLSAAHSRFEQSCIREEKRWLPRFTHLLATSQDDALRLKKLAPSTPVTVYANALPLVSVPRVAEEAGVIAFSGNFEYNPNIQGVRFFVEEIWPRLRALHPQLMLRLIGKNPAGVAKWTSGVAGIETTGAVEDAVAELARAQVVVVPLLSGSGTRLKILEAWAAARAVISTTIGAEGLQAKSGENIVLQNAPQEFAASVSELLGSKEIRARMGCAGRQTYEEVFTWPAAWRGLSRDVFG